MDRSRLRLIRDISPVPGNGLFCPSGTLWQSAGAPSVAPIIVRVDGYTATVVANPIVTWFRTFTTGNTPPEGLETSRSLVTLHEWIPTSMPTKADGWRHLSSPDLAAVALLTTEYRATWSEHARRHLKLFERSGLTLKLGTIDDVKTIYPRSTVPRHLQTVFMRHVERRLAHQPETIDVLLAVTTDGAPCAAFVAGNCNEIRQSVYLLGCFLPEVGHHQPMTGLVDWWFARSLERGCVSVNFGDIVPRHTVPLLEGGIGYSVFKTHFGIHRVWLPGSFWKVVM